jgi:hypothetical protein
MVSYWLVDLREPEQEARKNNNKLPPMRQIAEEPELYVKKEYRFIAIKYGLQRRLDLNPGCLISNH